MKNPATLLMVLGMAALLNSAALAQQKSEYNPFTKDEQTVSKLEEQWANAILTRQTTFLQELLSDGYTVVGPSGKTLTKDDELGLVLSEDFKLEALGLEDLKVRVYTGGAVATGRVVVKGKAKDKDLSGVYRFTDIFEPRQGRWQVVARQLTKVEEEKK